jgi:hypothetical protein
MSIHKVPNTNYEYYLVAHDENGVERKEDGSLLSQRVLDQVEHQPVTDVFIMSHGWRGDGPAAVAQYDAWTSNLMTAAGEADQMRRVRPNFVPMLIGWHWPSEPWGDESPGSFALDEAADPIASAVDDYAKRLGVGGISEELAAILRAHVTIDNPQTVPPDVRGAYQKLREKLGLGVGSEGAAPGADLPGFDPEEIFQSAREVDSTPSFAGFGIGDLLAPLRVLSFWKMKDRARRFGEAGGASMLTAIRRAAGRPVHVHLMGHSFGCIVVSAALAGASGSAGNVADSLVLVQGALSLWGYCEDIPSTPGTPGYFHRLLTGKNVTGPVVTTQSQFDSAVGTFYPLAAGLRGQVAFDMTVAELPKYGAVGTFGIQGAGAAPEPSRMAPATQQYHFEPGKIYNLESSQYIRTGNPPSGAHSDIVHPEVAHVIWEAARSAAASGGL